jgi:hypothetical protein
MRRPGVIGADLRVKFSVKMASGLHCEECRRLTDLYLDSVRDHASLMDEEHETLHDDPDIECRRAQAERRVHQARERFLTHRAKHSSE